ncbi:LuxR C-terminal-related transcriptional regulator [Ekhidna sp.]
MILRISIILICIVASLYGQSQEYIFTRLTEEEGLPGNQTTCFLKDRNGFMWIGTTSGLCRYDGKQIKSYTKDLGYGISDDNINSIIQDADGILWIGTNGGGLNKLDPSSEEFTTFKHDPDDPLTISGDRIRKLVHGDSGTIWIAFDNGIGLSKFNKKTGVSVNYAPFNMIKSSGVKAIRGMVWDPKNPMTLWLGTTSGLIRFDIAREEFELIDHPLRKIDRYGLFALDQIDENRLIGGFFHAGLDIYDINKKEWENVYSDPKSPIRIFDLARKSEKEFWVAARKKGLAVYNIDEKKLRFIPSDLNNYSTPFPGFTMGVYNEEDRVWVGGKYGVSYSNIKSDAFRFEPISPKGITNSQIIGISEKFNKRYMLALPLKGLLEFDKKSNQSKLHSAENEGSAFYQMLEREDIIYLTDRNRYLYVFDKKTASFEEIQTPMVDQRTLAIRGIKEWTDTHAIILTAYGGAWKLAYKTNQITPLMPELNTDEWQQDLLSLEDGTLWIGGTKGIVKFDPSTNEISEVSLEVIDSREKHIHTMAQGDDGVIWMGTSRGLIKLDGGEETLYNVQNSELAGNLVFDIVIADNDLLWLKTQKGISKFIPSEMKVVNYNRADGIDPAGTLISTGGDVLYGTYNGYFVLSEQTINKLEEVPAVHLHNFQVANEDFESEYAINYTEDINLEYWENFFSFTFSTPNFQNPDRLQYSYRLLGLDDEWITNNRRFATFTNLDGGTYTFEVRARSIESDWGPTKSIRIHLASPFWKTWWFYLICGLVIVGSGILIYKLRIRTIQRMADLAAQELQIEALKNRFTELHTSPAEIAVQLNFRELNEKLNNPLTIREFEVLKLSLEGKTNAEISDDLSISISTVKFHLRNTYSKMGVGNRKEAFQYMLNA